jgi:hypothetical protein
MQSDDLFIKAGGEFPYRRYINGTSGNILKLVTLIKDYTPMYDPKGFDQSLIQSKVISRLPIGSSIFDLFAKGPKNVSQKIDWDLDAVIDQYTETARMSSPGYGKTYTPLDLWFQKSNIKDRAKVLQGKKSLTEVREAIWKVGEVRLAYTTDSIGLYNHINKTLIKSVNTPTVIDITAFGDRLVAAAATGFNYIGLDPDPNLVDGISRLTLDVKAIVPDFKCETYTLPLEHFMPPYLVDLVTFSPPPYDAEPYSGGDRQVHKVYSDFNHWFYGFIREALFRASYWLKDGGILAFSVLDRPTIVYTEAMIMAAMSIGFRPMEIFTLSSDKGTPWWIFKKDIEYENTMFSELYMDFIPKPLSPVRSPHIEYLRLLAAGYVAEICKNHNIMVEPLKVKKVLEGIYMSKIPEEDAADPLFPDAESDIIIKGEDFNDIKNVIFPIVIQTPDAGYRNVIMYSEDKFTEEVLIEIFNGVNGFLHWIQCTNEFKVFSKVVSVNSNGAGGHSSTPWVSLDFSPQYFASTYGFLRKRTLFVKKDLDGVSPRTTTLWASRSHGITRDNVSSYIRYAAIASVGHQYTRTESRIQAIAKIVNVNKDSIVDLFASPVNANSKLYCSVYPDVDPGSLGNFFLYDGGSHKVLMSNPPPEDGFKEIMVNRLLNVYLLKSSDKIIFHSTTVWYDNAGESLEKIKAGVDPEFKDFKNYFDLAFIWSSFKEYIRAVYILDHLKHPSFDAAQGKNLPKTRPTESVGVILSKNPLDLKDLKELSGGAHVIFEKRYY